MPYLHTLVLALHVLFAAAWFGLGLALPALARSVTSGGDPSSADKTLGAMNVSAVLFYAFAMANFILGSGLGFQYGWPYHFSLTLGLILVAVQFALIRPGWARFAQGGERAESGRKKMAMGLGIGHLVWLTMFVLMYFGRGAIGA